MGLITKIALSKYGQRFYKFVADPKNEKLVNNITPTLESAVAGIVYIWATDKQKNIDPRRKHMLQVQNVLTTVAGIGLGSYINKKASNYAERIIPHLKGEAVKDFHKVVAGFKILAPLFATAFLMRLVSPVVAAFISGKVEEKRHKNKLNVVA